MSKAQELALFPGPPHFNPLNTEFFSLEITFSLNMPLTHRISISVNSHLSGGSFLAGKASWALSGCLPIESADHCMLVNEGAWLRSRVCLLKLEVELGSVLESELSIF